VFLDNRSRLLAVSFLCWNGVRSLARIVASPNMQRLARLMQLYNAKGC
jgi:hypothetical protein